MRIRYLIRFALLTLGFGLTTFGVLAWQQIDFELDTMWPFGGQEGEGIDAHPVFVIVLGMALIPPTLWEIFVLENSRDQH